MITVRLIYAPVDHDWSHLPSEIQVHAVPPRGGEVLVRGCVFTVNHVVLDVDPVGVGRYSLDLLAILDPTQPPRAR